MGGWRRSMEDSHIANTTMPNGLSLFGVFDGHGGQATALYVKKHYVKCLTNLPSFKSKNYRLALEESFLKIDEMMLTDSGKKELGASDESGCTATVALVTPTEIFCCNAGDSRTILSKGKSAIDLSIDHKPNLPDEQRRIYNANGYVEDNRVDGMLALSRALGDFEYKKNPGAGPKDQKVTAFPEIKSIQLTTD